MATDKTQLTSFSGGKQAYPVYLTLGNIPRRLRRKVSEQACVLLAYLPTDKVNTEHLTDRETTGRGQRLFHEAMHHILQPLEQAGRSGVELTTADGKVRLGHPIVACYVADFPEQTLVACAKGGTCPKSQTGARHLGDVLPRPARTQAWTLGVMTQANRNSTTSGAYFKLCMDREVSGHIYRPFWTELPFTDIHLSLTPDILHQIYQGVVRTLVEWCQLIVTDAVLDARVRCLPHVAGVRSFKHGISGLSQVTGTERKSIAKILLPCLVDIMPAKGLEACHALLDFVYLSQYDTHDNNTLQELEDALSTWHQRRHFFVDIGVRNHFNIPKFHSLVHYLQAIRMFGTTDNYNTEMFERLHIDFAKKAFRASNRRNEMPQMSQWLDRRESVDVMEQYVSWAREQYTPEPNTTLTTSKMPQVLFPKYPTARKPFGAIQKHHRVPYFFDHLKEYLHLVERVQDSFPSDFRIHFSGVDVFHKFKLRRQPLADAPELETIRASTADGGRFDTVVVITGDSAEGAGLDGKYLLFDCHYHSNSWFQVLGLDEYTLSSNYHQRFRWELSVGIQLRRHGPGLP